jgi:peptidoglycan/LPS O-acetylase OafA/YrhL
MTNAETRQTVNAARASGLDVCRTLAILLVVAGHTSGHSQPNALLKEAGFVGLFGVDLFYCLSGFLIGRILLAESAAWQGDYEKGLFSFWYRRWMRTLPLYYFYFFFLLKFDWTGGTSVHAQMAYLLFAQNLVWPMPLFYGLSWSLAVEEWFYLGFPLVLLLFIGLGQNARKAALLACAAFAIGPFLLRWFLPASIPDLASFDEGLRHVVVFRLDALGFGVLMAYFFLYRRAWFDRIAMAWPIPALVIILVATATKLHYPGFADSTLLAPVYFSVSAVAFALLIPKFYTLPASRFSVVNRFFKFTSLVSYSLYLGHIPAFVIVIGLLRRMHLYDAVYPNPWLLYPLFIAAAYGVAITTYFAIERPVLRLRDRRSQGAFHPVGAEPAIAALTTQAPVQSP